ncbi:WD repeat-containing protein 75 [Diorhabda sublineata]|uniref:WD repeat-containing protein 75 n=1 Tax=Diorhabda sublineata TaxID=1163346 RepID=UPI0024E10C96|nr:WD repeat-containing protein 75 [Diorhabda sublineata]
MVESDNKVEITVNYKGGGSFVKLPPQFSNDGQLIFMSSKESVLEYNANTSKLVHQYKCPGRIIGFSYHVFENNCYITACTRDGIMTTWKTVTRFKIAEKKLPQQNIRTFQVVQQESEDFKAIYSHSNGKIFHFTLWNGELNKSNNYNLILDKKFFINANKNFFAVAHGNQVCFIKLNDFKSVFRSYINDSRKLTCISVHPSEELVLTGDSTGRVLGWYNIFSDRAKNTVFHWHTLPVQTVSFSNTGSYFYTGGGESVLVKWQYENQNDRKFVPRIPGEICQIAVAANNLYVAVSTNDNAVRIFNNTLNQVGLIQNLVLAQHFDSGIVYDTRTRALIMNGNQGHVQFYSPDDLSLLYSVDITGQNKITNERETTMINTEIKKVTISKSGLWFATVEERNDKEYNHEIRLKFWQFDEFKQEFHLNTSVEYPHEASINSMLFQPIQKDRELKCVTIGDDNKFKIWQLIESEILSSTQLSWKCFGVGFYRNLSCNALSFSIDGSLFATGFEKILTVWTPDTSLLKCSLVHPLHKQNLRYVQFGHGNLCHLLVAASNNQLSVWNILTLSMTWTVPISVSFLIADSLSTHMAIITNDKKVFVFSPNSSQPVYVNNEILRKFKSIKACSFVPSKNSNDLRLNWYERSQLYFITSENELYCMCESSLMSQTATDEYTDIQSVFSMIQPNIKSSSVQKITAQKHLFEKDKEHRTLKTYLESPIHTLPPIRFSCYSIIKSFVIQDDADEE